MFKRRILTVIVIGSCFATTPLYAEQNQAAALSNQYVPCPFYGQADNSHQVLVEVRHHLVNHNHITCSDWRFSNDDVSPFTKEEVLAVARKHADGVMPAFEAKLNAIECKCVPQGQNDVQTYHLENTRGHYITPECEVSSPSLCPDPMVYSQGLETRSLLIGHQVRECFATFVSLEVKCSVCRPVQGYLSPVNIANPIEPLDPNLQVTSPGVPHYKNPGEDPMPEN